MTCGSRARSRRANASSSLKRKATCRTAKATPAGKTLNQALKSIPSIKLRKPVRRRIDLQDSISKEGVGAGGSVAALAEQAGRDRRLGYFRGVLLEPRSRLLRGGYLAAKNRQPQVSAD